MTRQRRLCLAPEDESVTPMAQKPLSEAGGEAFSVVTKFPHEQVNRVVELANQLGKTRSEFIREAVTAAIERAEAEDQD